MVGGLEDLAGGDHILRGEGMGRLGRSLVADDGWMVGELY